MMKKIHLKLKLTKIHRVFDAPPEKLYLCVSGEFLMLFRKWNVWTIYIKPV